MAVCWGKSLHFYSLPRICNIGLLFVLIHISYIKNGNLKSIKNIIKLKKTSSFQEFQTEDFPLYTLFSPSFMFVYFLSLCPRFFFFLLCLFFVLSCPWIYPISNVLNTTALHFPISNSMPPSYLHALLHCISILINCKNFI